MQYTRFMPLVFAALLGGLIWLLNRAVDIPDERASPSPAQPDLIASHTQVRRFDASGQLQTTLMAVKAQHIPRDDTTLFETLQLEQTQPGKPKISIRSEQARSIHRGAEVWFTGQVEVLRAPDANNPALQIRTQNVYLNSDTQIARSSAPVSAEMGPHRARAVGFIADNRNETLELLSQVSMTYVPKK